MKETTQDHRITRRGMLHVGSAALAGVAALTVADAQDKKQTDRSPDHHLPNEREPGPNCCQKRHQCRLKMPPSAGAGRC